MSNFEEAIDFLLPREGGLNENPADMGGSTNFGISLRFLRELPDDRLKKYGIFKPIDEDTIRGLTLPQVKFIYRGEFWENTKLNEIDSQDLCNYIFDMIVNLGESQAIKLVQRATWAATFIKGYLKDDGILGSKTIGALNSIGSELIPILMGIRGEFYRQIVVAHPKQDVNLEGWLNRTYESSNVVVMNGI